MKRIDIRIFVACVGLFAMLSPGLAQTTSSTEPEELSGWGVPRAINSAVQYVVASRSATSEDYIYEPGSAQIISTTELVFAVTNNGGKVLHLRINVQGSDPCFSKCVEKSCFVFAGPKKQNLSMRDDEKHKDYILYFGVAKLSDSPGYGPVCSKAKNNAECMHSAALFAAALNAMRKHAANTSASTADFHQQAVAWRSLSTKPPVSEGARIHRLLAEEAVGQKQLNEALNHYELGVESNPTWATGWRNAALLAGELGYYADAAHHMQNYLELVPDAEDAQAARDSMDIWKYKAAH